MSINIAIVGHGYVGKAVDHGFSTSQVSKYIVDPIYGSPTIEDLVGKIRLDAAFVCVPTPDGDSGWSDRTKIFFFVINSSTYNAQFC